ncbi:DNA protecting protein DprA [Primorskyibacter flagellatus]|uniref:DNA protecting protein DprA n=2 Tax=Primorskyibacter flagellatus TaxID=1387277 RepID=A0A1W2CWL6_9RHOB|nr:DNA-processing protein DprA [Primorskyibacter flagellatus]SMC89098.1 DNA protecting protein DprA [Primorskyibacter flagellatus]
MTKDAPSTHPPLPPTTEAERLSCLRLLRSRRVGATTFHRLMQEHGSAAAALDALPSIAAAAGVENYTICPEGVALAEYRAGRAAGAQLLCWGDAAYPEEISDLSDAPPLLWAMGDPALLARPMVALVGARNASSLGTRMARKLAGDLSDLGYVVVSGLARGVDTAAHLASLQGGTVAVQAGGVDVMYPAENTRLAEDILANGGLRLSEMPMGLQPQARHFPARNRIISGLVRAVVVVEAAARSGSLITARCALDQGREVLAVPGHPFDARAGGCNMLIRDGATLVRSAEDIVEALPQIDAAPKQAELDLQPVAQKTQQQASRPTRAQPADKPKPKRSLKQIAALHQLILDRLGPSPVAEDQLIRDLGAPAQSVAPVLIDLELDGKVRRQPGGLLSRG